ncbi:chemotaxis protein [Priestia megaterium]|uniref:chemotaxis protein n=1 Tax=Priestia megaterium TaxID=1404 RepID=UPI003000112A
MQKVATVIIHGLGEQDGNYASETCKLINQKFEEKLYGLIDDPLSQLIIEPICWSKIFSCKEQFLYDNVLDNHLNYLKLRQFVIKYLGDAIAYQRVESAQQNYDMVHNEVSKALTALSEKAGNKAPLCVIAHSLGSTIASNYFYDLQFKLNDVNWNIKAHTPLERGETLTLFYTLGSTLPLWSLRYIEKDFNHAINIPSQSINKFYPKLKGEWINFYDKDDILGYPLKGISDGYRQAVDEDKEVSVRGNENGNIKEITEGIIEGWTPLCHINYLTDKNVLERIVEGLVRTWKHVNDI